MSGNEVNGNSMLTDNSFSLRLESPATKSPNSVIFSVVESGGIRTCSVSSAWVASSFLAASSCESSLDRARAMSEEGSMPHYLGNEKADARSAFFACYVN
jgi:hypothetical protein